MTEHKITAKYLNRREQGRFTFLAGASATLCFNYPTPHGPRIDAQIRDISLSGLSMLLSQPLIGLEVGDILKGIEAQVEKKLFRGDLLIMHVTSEWEGAILCGGLFYPEGDGDLITIRLVVRMLEAASRQNS